MSTMNRLIMANRNAWFVACLCLFVTFAGQGRRLVAADPFGGGAGGAADPFGVGADPFGGKMTEKQRRQILARALLNKAEAVVKKMLLSEHDAVFFEAAMSMVERGEADPEEAFITGVASLARRDWKLRDGETPKSLVARLEKEFETSPGDDAAAFRRMSRKYKEVLGMPWQFEWRKRKEIWSGLFETVIASKRAEDPSAPWRQRIEANEKFINLYSLGYLGFVRSGHVKQDQLDFDLLDSILKRRSGKSARDLAWQIRVFESYISGGLPPEHKRRSELLEQLVENIQTAQIAGSWTFTLPAIGNLCKRSSPMTESDPILQAVLHRAPSQYYRLAARRAGKTNDEILMSLLRRTTSVDYKGVALGQAVADLQNQIGLSIWVDEEVQEYAKTTTIHIEGTWQEVLQAVLKETPFRFDDLRGETYFIGSPDSIKATNDLITTSLAKIPGDENPIHATLREDSKSDFIETPLYDVCEYLSDRHGMAVKLLKGFGQQPVTLTMDGPLHLILTRMSMLLKFDWAVSEQHIIIGSKEDIKTFSKRNDTRAQRIARLAEADSSVAKALAEDTRLEFIETPLVDVFEYFGDRHRVPFYVLSSARETSITMDVRRTSLGWAMDYMSHLADLAWDADNDVIYVGKEKQVAQMQQLSESRAERRKKFPKDIRDKLSSTTDLRLVVRNAELETVADFLKEKTGIQMTFPTDDDKLRRHSVTCALHKMPLDVMLDILAIENDIRWQMLNGSVHVTWFEEGE